METKEPTEKGLNLEQRLIDYKLTEMDKFSFQHETDELVKQILSLYISKEEVGRIIDEWGFNHEDFNDANILIQKSELKKRIGGELWE